MKITGREQFEKFAAVIQLLAAVLRMFGKKGNYFLLCFFRNTNGKMGLLLRYVFLKNLVKRLGNNVSIQPGVYLFNLQNIEIGDNVSIHPMCYIEGAGGITIGNNVSIAHNCSILTTNHQWSDVSIPIKYNRESYSSVYINDDVWLGCGVRILAGVEIKSRSIIAAGAVVNKNVESNTIYGGVPAKLIKYIK